LGLEGAKQFVGSGLKNTSDVIFYASVDHLCLKLAELCAARKAGNNGLDNVINSILVEFPKVQAISKGPYDILYKNIVLLLNIMTSFILNSNKSNFTICHDTVILNPNKNYEAALLSLDTYNSIANISISEQK